MAIRSGGGDNGGVVLLSNGVAVRSGCVSDVVGNLGPIIGSGGGVVASTRCIADDTTGRGYSLAVCCPQGSFKLAVELGGSGSVGGVVKGIRGVVRGVVGVSSIVRGVSSIVRGVVSVIRGVVGVSVTHRGTYARLNGDLTRGERTLNLRFPLIPCSYRADVILNAL